MKNKDTKLWLLLTLLLIHSTNEGFLQIDTKRNCPNGPLSSLGILISLAETEDDEGLFKNTLSPEERESYENMISLKRSFASTMSYIPQNFSPEKQSYWDGLEVLVIVFIIIAFFPFIFIIFYLILRFICKKCTGPRKISEVNKQYRNLTWLMLITSTIAAVVLLSIILVKSISVNNGINSSLNAAADQITKREDVFDKINNAVVKFRTMNLDVPNAKYMDNFKQLIESYFTNTKTRTNQILEDESSRQTKTIIVFVVINFLAILAYLFFCLKLEKIECLLSIIMFFTIPVLIVFEGYNAKFFFYYGDLCDTVHGALHENEIPVADQAFGYYYNCFPLETKAQLYNIRYRLYQAAINAPEKQEELFDIYDILNTQTFEPLFNCEIVSEVVPKIEREFCKTSLDNMYSIVLLLTWVLLSVLILSIGTRRLEVLIWKRRNEIESMIQNQEVMF